MSKEDLAGVLYDSINNKIKPLNDDITVYPGHGAGSACGKRYDEGNCRFIIKSKNNQLFT